MANNDHHIIFEILQFECFTFFQHRPRPRSHIRTIDFRILRADIHNRLHPCNFVDDWPAILGGNFEFAFANEYDLEVGFELIAEHTDLQVLSEKACISAAKATQ
jgi:hypothetical protein